MSAISGEDQLLSAARGGDEGAYTRLVERHRGELHAHCYRMLGSVHDADDALQDALLRAWRAIGRFEGRSSAKSWLYKIATNTCLDLIAKRPKRVLPIDYAPATPPNVGPGEPVVESVWIEPYPDERMSLPDGLAGPEARYEQREGLELAFIAALQHLPARQRAVLILREVLGYSAKEVADLLETSVASVNSALQRARAAVDERTPEQTQQATLRSLGDADLSALVESYLRAWETNDVDAVVHLLAEDASIAMPPLASWYGPKNQMVEFLRGWPMSGSWRWKARQTTANGQPALGFYAWDPGEEVFLPFALNVLAISEGKVRDVVAFVVRSTRVEDPEGFHRWVDEPAEPMTVARVFGDFGLPDQLPAST